MYVLTLPHYMSVNRSTKWNVVLRCMLISAKNSMQQHIHNLLSTNCLDLVLAGLLHLHTAEPDANIQFRSPDHSRCSSKVHTATLYNVHWTNVLYPINDTVTQHCPQKCIHQMLDTCTTAYSIQSTTDFNMYATTFFKQSECSVVLQVVQNSTMLVINYITGALVSRFIKA